MSNVGALPQAGEIRPWPYPYEAALSISSDPDCAELAFLDELMKFLNTKERTKFGIGIGVEAQTSLFHYSSNPDEASIWNGTELDSPISKDAPRLQEYLRAGWVDALHAFGNFDGGGGFTRHHAERVATHLGNHNARVPGFTNHGGYDNIQNVGGDARYHQGDVQGSDAYHSDKWAEWGIQYVWTDSMIYHDYSEPARPEEPVRRKLRKIANSFAPPRLEYPPYFQNEQKELIAPISLQDGSQVFGFNRFRGTGGNAPNLSSLGAQLRAIPWPDLYLRNRWVVLYQHLGVGFRLNGKAVPASVEMILDRPEVFLAPFRFLKNEQDAGLLWIAGTSRLLDYLLLRDSITVTYQDDGEIHLSASRPFIVGKSLSNLTIYIDPSRFRGLFWAGEKVEYLPNGPDASGAYSVSVTNEPLESIWE